MIKPVFANNELYHVYNRGVEKRNLFMDEADYSRFVHNLYDFNDHSPVLNVKYDALVKSHGMAKKNFDIQGVVYF